MKPLCPQPIGYINKQRLVLRAIKAVYVMATTKFSWRAAWHIAAR